MIYLQITFAILITQFFSRKASTIPYLISLGLLFLISATRINVGIDTIAFEEKFRWIITGFDTYMEAGFEFLGLSIYNLGGGYQTFIFVCTIPVFIMLHTVITQNIEKEYWLYALFLSIATGLIFTSYNIFRQFIAISFCFFAIEFFLKNKYFLTILSFVGAFYFHKSMLFFVLTIFSLYYFREKKVFKWLLLSIYLMSLCFIFLDFRPIFNVVVSLIPTNYDSYLDSVYLLERSSTGFLKTFFPSAIFLLYMIKIPRNIFMDKRKAMYSIGFFLAVVSANVFNGVVILIRLADYFFPFIIVGTIWTIEKTKRWERLILTSVVTSYYLFLLYFAYIYPNAMSILPYSSTLFSLLGINQ